MPTSRQNKVTYILYKRADILPSWFIVKTVSDDWSALNEAWLCQDGVFHAGTDIFMHNLAWTFNSERWAIAVFKRAMPNTKLLKDTNPVF